MMEFENLKELQSIANKAKNVLNNGIKSFLREQIESKGSANFEEMENQMYLPIEESVYSGLKIENFGGDTYTDVEIWGIFLDKDSNILCDCEGAFYYLDDINEDDWMEIADQARMAEKVAE